MARYNSIIETVGRTPVVRVNRLAPEGVNLWVKVEAFNPPPLFDRSIATLIAMVTLTYCVVLSMAPFNFGRIPAYFNFHLPIK